MEQTVIVGYDGTQAGMSAIWRAQQLAPEIVVLSGAGAPPDGIVTWNVPVVLHEVDLITMDVLFAAADSYGSSTVVVGESLTPMPALLKHALAAAMDASRPPVRFASLLVVRRHDVHGDAAYERILAGADGSAGSGFAALVAAWIAQVTDATLQIAALERRKDLERRRLWDLRAARPGFDPAAFRTPLRPSNPRLDQARSLIAVAGIAADFEYLVGDPCTRLLDAAGRDNADLIVSGLLMAQSGRNLDPGLRMTRDMLMRGRTDHLVVFDSVTVGTASPRRTTSALAAAARDLLGSARPADRT